MVRMALVALAFLVALGVATLVVAWVGSLVSPYPRRVTAAEGLSVRWWRRVAQDFVERRRAREK